MKTKNLIVAAVISVGLAVGATAQAGKPKEMSMQFKMLPLAVQKTIKSKAGKDKIVRVVRETVNGKDVYEGIVNKDGKETAIQVDDMGHYLGTHDESAEQGKMEKKPGKVEKANKAEGH
jgi:hypothetical protein